MQRASQKGSILAGPPGAAKPFSLKASAAKPDPIDTALVDGMRFRDPYKDLAAQRARPLFETGAAPKPAPIVAAMPALAPDARPRPAWYFYELGLTCAAMGELSNAEAALRRAVSVNPALRAAWDTLGEVLTLARDPAGAEAAFAQAREAVDTEIRRPGSTLSAAKLERECQAWGQRLAGSATESPGRALREHLRIDPTDVAALRVLASIGLQRGLNTSAQLLLERALELAPRHVPLRMEYITVLTGQGKHSFALPFIERLVAEHPSHVPARINLAGCLTNLGKFDRALALYEGLMGEVEKEPALLANYSFALRYAGRRAESVRACRRCLELAPGIGRAWWSLAELKNEQFTPADILQMRRQLENKRLHPLEHFHIHYALGAALERAGDYAESFEHYAQGAALRRAEVFHDASEWTKEMERQRAFYTAGRLADFAAHGHSDPAPIFIVGLPRVGSTLIEQILASHSLVEGTHELDEIGVIVEQIAKTAALGQGSLFLERVAALSPVQIDALGARYIRNTRQFRRTARPFFVDKMPGNWVYTGLIHSILPHAKIIDARRNPMASGFAAFKQLFAAGAVYSFDLTEVGRFYVDYVKTMAHFDQVLPGRVHRVNYESMVTDTEAEIRRLLDYCELPFEPACLRFWETARAVATPSAEQVRRPISRDSMDQWRNYEPWLGPLKSVFQGAGLQI